MTDDGAECLVAQFKESPGAAKACATSCEKKDGVSCTTLGSMYERGHLVPADPAQAQAFYQRGCDLGEAQGCYDLGRRANASGDVATAVLRFGFACDHGEGVVIKERINEACTFAGLAYLDGKGVPIDRPKAEGYLKHACKNGDMHACDQFDFKPKK
jgi:TPR repeat protein